MLHRRAWRQDRARADRLAIAFELWHTGHAHVIAPDGRWCITLTVLGPLWERLPPPQHPGPLVIYDEVFSWPGDG